MATAKLIECPSLKDHEGRRQRLFFMVNDGICLHCKKHGWIKYKFAKNGKELSFKDVAVSAHDLPDNYYFDAEPMEMLAYGEFKQKTKGLKRG